MEVRLQILRYIWGWNKKYSVNVDENIEGRGEGRRGGLSIMH